jgi:hypothetical protein
LVCVFAGGLSDLVRSYFTVSLLVLCENLVAASGLDPVLGPPNNVLLDCGITLVNSGLNSADEVRQSSVAPFVSLEIDLEPIGKSVPANQED